jgi:hypothetical protein
MPAWRSRQGDVRGHADTVCVPSALHAVYAECSCAVRCLTPPIAASYFLEVAGV